VPGADEAVAGRAGHPAANEARLIETRAENKRLRLALEQSRAEVERLRAELAAGLEQLHDVYASTSWRLSAPVRLIGGAGRRLSRLYGGHEAPDAAGGPPGSRVPAWRRRRGPRRADRRRPAGLAESAGAADAVAQDDAPQVAAGAVPEPPGRRNGLHERYPQYEIGRWTYGDLNVDAWDDEATLRVGAFCSIARGVQVILGGEHRSDWVTTFPFYALWGTAGHISSRPNTKGDVTIGNDVWIGTEATIMSGVTIGDGAVVGARALVARDVDPYTIVAGNPARPVRKRCSSQSIERLLRLRWWEWSDEDITPMIPWLLSADVEAFLLEAERRGRVG
jgi:acetyltransferase-like isoleucine patch superfamily enzyme